MPDTDILRSFSLVMCRPGFRLSLVHVRLVVKRSNIDADLSPRTLVSSCQLPLNLRTHLSSGAGKKATLSPSTTGLALEPLLKQEL
jgi:hypothetical protein